MVPSLILAVPSRFLVRLSELTDLFFHNLISLRSLISTPLLNSSLCSQNPWFFVSNALARSGNSPTLYSLSSIVCNISVTSCFPAKSVECFLQKLYWLCFQYMLQFSYTRFFKFFTKTRKKRNQFIKWKFLLLISLKIGIIRVILNFIWY